MPRNISSKNKPDFVYSDGTETEDAILNILKDVRDLSSSSDELENKIYDWPTQYHFSRIRHNLIRHLPIDKTQTVFEVGCGCGAMTRYLAENAKHVTAIDGSEKRIKIARERCRDITNIEFICKNIQDYHTARQFDFVTSIGVLEYANIYLSSYRHPALDFLSKLKSYLNKNGELLIAIENKLGLKYFAGYPEDHAGIQYYGLNSLYKEKNDFKTFGKAELETIIRAAGLKSIEFYYPFPDYKLPRAVFTESAFSTQISLKYLWQMASVYPSKKYHSCSTINFDEYLVWESLFQNNIMPELSNSFLIRASTIPIKPSEKNALVYFYSDPGRKQRVQVCASIQRIAELRSFQVEREYIYSSEDRGNHKLLPRSTFFDSPLLHLLILKAIHTRDHEKLLELIISWKHLLDSKRCEDEPQYLNTSDFDVNPFNIVYHDGKLICIDNEWTFPGKITIGQIFLHYYMISDNIIGSYINDLDPVNRQFISKNLCMTFDISPDTIPLYISQITGIYNEVICRSAVVPSHDHIASQLAPLLARDVGSRSYRARIKQRLIRAINKIL
jgi:2-polyprenyl-3-methyl-5-hydroxy-6-metoxy-1,4-benzoquinol methylase